MAFAYYCIHIVLTSMHLRTIGAHLDHAEAVSTAFAFVVGEPAQGETQGWAAYLDEILYVKFSCTRLAPVAAARTLSFAWIGPPLSTDCVACACNVHPAWMAASSFYAETLTSILAMQVANREDACLSGCRCAG
jgi:hypothetical protein